MLQYTVKHQYKLRHYVIVKPFLVITEWPSLDNYFYKNPVQLTVFLTAIDSIIKLTDK